MTVSTPTTSGQVLTSAYVNNNINSGLVWISTTTIGSTVTSVPVASCFSSTYDNYRIVISSVDCSLTDALFIMTLNNSAGSTYVYSTRWNNYSTAAFGGANSAGITYWAVGLTATNDNINYQVEVQSPNLAKRTAFTTLGSSDTNYVFGGGQDTNAVAQTGFTLAVTGAVTTFTGGTVTVYGYRKP